MQSRMGHELKGLVKYALKPCREFAKTILGTLMCVMNEK